ncbi:MAG: hypothetical protein V1663_03740 [archaeon]
MARLTKEEATRILSNVSEENKFWCNDGSALSNLQELEAALKNMNNETFGYHVNNEKNDFGNWIRDILKDDYLADEITKTKNKNVALKKLKNRLKTLNRFKK